MAESQFYSRATGKFQKSHRSFYTAAQPPKKSSSSVYSIESTEDDSGQYPLGVLSSTQATVLRNFISSITMNPNPEIDHHSRSIHTVGAWRFCSPNTTVVCTLVQPNITTATTGFRGMTYSVASAYAKMFAEVGNCEKPGVNKTTTWSQCMGRYSMLFADALVSGGIIDESCVTHTNVVLSQTQPIFCIVQGDSCFECRLSHASCGIMSELKMDCVNISPPTSGGHNYAFRSPNIRSGTGTGPSVTIHSSGIMQYQGSPLRVAEVVSCFRLCLENVLTSKSAGRFICSLTMVKKTSLF